MDVTDLLRYTVEMGASDLHLKAGNVPFVRVDGDLQPSPYPPVSSQESEAYAYELMPDHKRREFEETSEADFGYTLSGVGRFRSTCSVSGAWSAWRSGACDRRSRRSTSSCCLP